MDPVSGSRLVRLTVARSGREGVSKESARRRTTKGWGGGGTRCGDCWGRQSKGTEGTRDDVHHEGRMGAVRAFLPGRDG